MRQGGAPGLVVGALDDLKQRRWILAGARVLGLRAELGKEMGGRVLGFFGGGAEASYRLRGRRRPSGASTRTDGLPGATELFAATRKTTTSSQIFSVKRYRAGWPILGRAGWLRPGKLFSLFFLLIHLFLFTCFLFCISN
jgi:hypothetical protein